jgi:hypothetical protein
LAADLTTFRDLAAAGACEQLEPMVQRILAEERLIIDKPERELKSGNACYSTATRNGVLGSTDAPQKGVAEMTQGTRKCPEINNLARR